MMVHFEFGLKHVSVGTEGPSFGFGDQLNKKEYL